MCPRFLAEPGQPHDPRLIVSLRGSSPGSPSRKRRYALGPELNLRPTFLECVPCRPPKASVE